MVNPGMEHSGPPSPSDLISFLGSYGREEPCCESGGALGGAQDLPAPSEPPCTKALPPPSFLCLDDSHSLPDTLEGAGSKPEIPADRLSADVAASCGNMCCAVAHPAVSETPGLLAGKAEQPQGEALQPEHKKTQDQSENDATQALFWASILQAQMCVLDLQGEIDRQKEPEGICAPSPENVMPTSQDSAVSQEGLFLDSYSEEEEEEEEEEEAEVRSERQEEEESLEEEEEEEMEFLFYNNPLFQESPNLTRDSSFQGPPALCNHQDDKASTEESRGLSHVGLVSGLLPPAGVAVPSSMAWDSLLAPGLGADEDPHPCLVPTYVPHYRSMSPLVITEGDAENAKPPSAESTRAQDSFPERQIQNLPRSVLEIGPAAGTNDDMESLGEGLLFSASSTSLVSALLQEPSDSNEPLQPASPTEIHQTPPSFLVPSAPAAEVTLWQEKPMPQTPSRGQPTPSCARVEEPEPTSRLQEEVATPDLHSVALRGMEAKTEGFLMGFEMVEAPIVQAEEASEEEEEEAAAPRGAKEPPGETVPTKEMVEPNGTLFANGGTSGDQAAARRLAERLYHLDGFKRSQVASFLRKNRKASDLTFLALFPCIRSNTFSQLVAEEYLSFFHFNGLPLDQALRLFLKAFVLTGETQERERILRPFSQRYHSCNPEASLSADAVHTLTCAIMLLNTDLHGQNIGRSMTCQHFVDNLDGMNGGKNFPKELLKALYHSIRQEKLEWAADTEEPLSTQPVSTGGAGTWSRKKNNPFLTLSHDPTAKTYWQGLLARKVHAEADGKKTPWGKRSWKMLQTVLKGMVLYFFKEDGQSDTSGSEEPIGVHHALAERASKYTKRPYVFRLQTADWRVFLFQAPSTKDMNSWISRINLVSAMFSSPPFPAAVGSQRKFVRPVLPTAPSKSSLEDQHLAHEGWMDKVSDDLLEHQRNLPDKRGRGRDLEEYHLKKEYLLYEKRRYETYVRLLEAKLNNPTEDLDQWEARLGEGSSAEEGPSLKKSHSSPSLNVDGLPAGVKVKRNISERRTVRKIIPRRTKVLL